MTLVDDHHEIIGEVVEQAIGRFASSAAGQMAGVVFDAVAIAKLAQHLHVIAGALLNSLRFEQLSFGIELRQLLLQFGLDVFYGLFQSRRRSDEVFGRIDDGAVEAIDNPAGERLKERNLFDLIAKPFHANPFLAVGREDLQRVSAHAEIPTGEVHVVAIVLNVQQLTDHRVAIEFDATIQNDQAVFVLLRRTQTVDAAYRSDDDHVAALEQRRGGAQAQAVDLIIDRSILLNVCIAGRHIRFGLIIIVIRYKVFHRVLREELPKLTVELGRQSFVVR